MAPKIARRVPNSPPATPGWRRFPRNCAIQQVRRRYPFRPFSRFSALPRGLLTTALYCYWPIRAVSNVFRFAGRFGSRVAGDYGVSRLCQLHQLLFFSLACAVTPREYYGYRLFERENRKIAHLYVYGADMHRAGLSGPGKMHRADAIVNNKKAFEAFCRRNGFPHIPSFSTSHGADGRKQLKITGAPADASLVLKPCTGCRGQGVFLFEAQDGRYRVNRCSTCTREEGHARIFELVERGDYLVQPLIPNHPNLDRFSNGALISLRIVTLLTENGKAQYLAAVAQIPFGLRSTSNQGLIVPVYANGRLGCAQRLRVLSPQYKRHPQTGRKISGTIVPYYHNAVETVLNAHKALGAYASLGWDVGITPAGPVLIETNSGWDPGIIQRALGKPLGTTRLPELMLFHSSQ